VIAPDIAFGTADVPRPLLVVILPPEPTNAGTQRSMVPVRRIFFCSSITP
jgi:hypothetical protein